jgi:hypothetical protein
MTKRLDYPKSPETFEPICIYGPNMIAAEFDEWKRHRRIAGPSFSDKNNKVVHEETTQLTTELLDRWAADGGEVVSIDHAVTYTSRLTVMITAIAGESCVQRRFSSISILCPFSGFGYRFGWDDTEKAPAGHKMVGIWNQVESRYLTNFLSHQTFRTSLSTLLNNFALRVLFSDNILMLNKTGRTVVTAFKELGVCYTCHKLDIFT